MLGSAHAYEAGRDLRHLDAGRSAADWSVANAPPGWVPHHDYADPERNTLPYDSCAASIAVAVLLRLARRLPERAGRYRDVAGCSLRIRPPDFLSRGGVLLHGSWGRMRHVEPGKPASGGSLRETSCTFKVLACADAGREDLSRRVVFGRNDLVTYSPVTQDRAGGEGMTLAELCEATMATSDNTAGNLVLRAAGGPEGLTGYLRSIGDEATRLDRWETALNEARPGDPRDTTSPAAESNAAMAEIARALRTTVMG